MKHKVTQIEGEIVQLEESLAMPHAWVIEPSICEFNPQKLYRLVLQPHLFGLAKLMRIKNEV